jgi:hypothetical protein
MAEISWGMQRQRLDAFCRKVRPDIVVVETNAMGDPLLENLQQELPFPISGFYMTHVSKRQVIESLAMSIERGLLKYPDDPIFLNELEAFEVTITENRNIKYAASGRWHDDTVISTAIALSAHGGSRFDPRPLISSDNRYFKLNGPRATAKDY